MSIITSIEQHQRLMVELRECSPDDKIPIVRRLCRTDLYFLLWFACGRVDMEREWLFQRCREVQEAPDGYLDLWARDHYKSTIITFGKTLQDILSSHGEDPDPKWRGIEPTFGIFSHTRPTAKAFLRQIKREAEANELLKTCFPDILWANPTAEAPKWSEDDGLIFKRKSNPKESTVEAWGLVDGQPTGKHFWVRVYDDVVTRESVTTPEMIKKTTAAWELSVNLGTDEGIERYIGTRYAIDDTYTTMMERGVVEVRKYAATDNGKPDGKPVLLSEKALAKKQQAMGPFTFSCQMLQEPLPDETAFFKREWFKRYKPEDLPAGNDYLTSDFGVTEDGGDDTEIGIHRYGSDGDLYLCMDGWGGQKAPENWFDEYFNLVLRHKPLCEFNEAGVIRRSIEGFLSRRRIERKAYGRIEWITPISGKAQRARALQAMAASGRVHLPEGPYGDRILADLVKFTGRGNEKDHTVDMCALMARVIDEAHPGVIAKPKTQEKPDRWMQAHKRRNRASSWKVA